MKTQKTTFGKRRTFAPQPEPAQSDILGALGKKRTAVIALATIGAIGLSGAVYATMSPGRDTQANAQDVAALTNVKGDSEQKCATNENGETNCEEKGKRGKRRSFFFLWFGKSAAKAPAVASAPPALRPTTAPASVAKPASFGGFGGSAAAHASASS